MASQAFIIIYIFFENFSKGKLENVKEKCQTINIDTKIQFFKIYEELKFTVIILNIIGDSNFTRVSSQHSNILRFP